MALRVSSAVCVWEAVQYVCGGGELLWLLLRAPRLWGSVESEVRRGGDGAWFVSGNGFDTPKMKKLRVHSTGPVARRYVCTVNLVAHV